MQILICIIFAFNISISASYINLYYVQYIQYYMLLSVLYSIYIIFIQIYHYKILNIQLNR